MIDPEEALMQELWDRRLEAPELKAKIERLITEVDELRKQRDSARREYLGLVSVVIETKASTIAKERGWDCFIKEETT